VPGDLPAGRGLTPFVGRRRVGARHGAGWAARGNAVNRGGQLVLSNLDRKAVDTARASRRKAFEEIAASVRPPSWGRFFALRKRKGGMVVSEGAPPQWKLTKEAAN
jgi:hypothetical protein